MRVRFAVASTAPLLILSVAVHAQQTEADEGPREIVVTGTRVQDRSRLDTLAPVDVFTSESLTTQGTTELAESLATIAPSVNFPRPAVTDGTDHIRPATLRGLAPDQTLVLVNSKRRHTSALVNVNSSVGRGSAAVDLNAIPLAAIDRVEVLRDGASAQYGSDAIAGVLNIRLREARQGGGASVTFGEYDTDFRTARSDERSASDGTTVTASAWAGFPLGDEGFLTLSGEYRDRDPTSRGDLDPRLATQNPPEPLRVNSRYGDPEMEDLTFYVNAGVPLNETWEVYGWAGYQDRDGSAAATPRIRDNPNNDPALYPEGFLPLITSDVEDITVGWGVRGTWGEWDTDVSLVYGRNELQYGVENSLNGTLVPNSPTSFDSGGLEYDQLVFNFGLVRGFDVGLAGPANLAVGLEARRETFAINAGEPASYIQGPRTGAGITPGAQGFPGFKPENELDEDRTAVGIYADLETQITDRFLGSVAVRAEDYSDFGSAVTGKLSARYDFTETFALRGTVSTGFRAPSLQQQFFTSTATNFFAGQPFEVGTFPATSPVAQALGARELDAEESVNYSLGAVFRLGALEATVDAYRIDIDDRIVLSENLGGRADISAILEPFNVGFARFFINGVDTETQGVDVVVRYRFELGGSNLLDVAAAANFNDTDVTSVPSTDVLSVLDPPPVLFGRVNTLIFEEATPDSKLSLNIDWRRAVTFGQVGATLRTTRYGEVVDPGTAIDGSQSFEMSDKTLVDLELHARVGENFRATIGADNLFDQYPDQVPAQFNTNGLTGFSRFSPFGFNGRFIYARLGWDW
jgi:iron complex outermembrane receptor protein